MAALFFTFYESDSFRKEPHRPHQRRIFIRISLQDFIGRDESGEGAIGFGEIIKILESQCLGAVMQCGAGLEIFKAASVTAVAVQRCFA